jgi:hypothetical protein
MVTFVKLLTIDISGALDAILIEFGALDRRVAPQLTWRNTLHVNSLVLLVIFDFHFVDLAQLRGCDSLN